MQFILFSVKQNAAANKHIRTQIRRAFAICSQETQVYSEDATCRVFVW